MKKAAVLLSRGVGIWQKIKSYDNVQNVEPVESAILCVNQQTILFLVVLVIILFILKVWLSQRIAKKSCFYRE